MNKFEKLINERPNLKIKMVDAPSKHFGGLLIDETVYLNRNLSYPEQYEHLHEEVSHYDFTVGDISEEKTLDDRKQEKFARSKAMESTVTLDGLIYCFSHELWLPEEIADYFEVTEKYLRDALDNYAAKRGLIFKFKSYYFDLRRGLNITKI